MSGVKAFVVGWPVGHSRSPLIHRTWLRRYGIEGDYVAEAVDADGITDFLGGFARRGYVGGNVTLPHKEVAFRAAPVATPVAEKLEAANTLWLADGRLHADNTDAHGFAANLDDRAPDWRKGSTALVVGAGGAARAVLYALQQAGYGRIILLNRTASRAAALAEHFGPPLEPGSLDRLEAAIGEADLVVNATAAGLHEGQQLAIPWHRARQGAIATDLVYVPLMTPFLQGAAAHGLVTADGLGMLLHQAAPGFERWFGVRPSVDAALRALVAADIAR